MANVKGTYALLLSLDEESHIVVGRLTERLFPPGYYLYVGSALGGLFQRIERHIRGDGRLHWHIDYLRRKAVVVEIWYVVSGEQFECSWYKAALKIPHASVPVSGFGSSGCRCGSHLLYFTHKPAMETFRRALGTKGLGLQRLSVKDLD